jgi:hypothetical protein
MDQIEIRIYLVQISKMTIASSNSIVRAVALLECNLMLLSNDTKIELNPEEE